MTRALYARADGEHTALKLHCVEREQSVMAFVVEAVPEKLRRAGIRRA